MVERSVMFMTPHAPSSVLAMTTSSASATIPHIANGGRVAFLRNEAPSEAYIAFGATADTTAGFRIDPGAQFGPLVVPEGETLLSAILIAGTGNLIITFALLR